MTRTLSFSLLLSLSLCVVGCGGSGAASSRVQNTFRENLGAHPASNIVSTTDDALQVRYGYRFTRRVETGEDIYYETEWKDLAALEDERVRGVDFVRIKVYVSARPRNRSAGSLASYTATFRAEVSSRVNMTGEWTEMDLTPEREAYLKEIADYMESELRIAFRH